MWLTSRCGVPAELQPLSSDRRCLNVCVERLVLREAGSLAGTGAGSEGMAAAPAAGTVLVSAGWLRPEGAAASAVGTATDTEPIDYRRVNHAHFGPCTQLCSGSSACAVG
jgi:hypothetical protein